MDKTSTIAPKNVLEMHDLVNLKGEPESPVTDGSCSPSDDIPRYDGAFQFGSPLKTVSDTFDKTKTVEPIMTEPAPRAMMTGPPKFERQVTGNQDEPEKKAVMGPPSLKRQITGPPKFERQVTGNQDEPEKKAVMGPPSLKRQITGPPKFERQVTGNQNDPDTTNISPKGPGPLPLGRQITGPPQLKRNITANHAASSSDILIPITEVHSLDFNESTSTKVLSGISLRVEAYGASESFKGSNFADTNTISYGHQSLNGTEMKVDLITESLVDMSLLDSVDCDDLFNYKNHNTTATGEENTDDLHATLTNYADLDSSISSLGGRKGQEIQSAKEKDTFYLEQDLLQFAN